MHFSSDQESALEALRTRDNIFLTGRAGTGKSTVLKAYLRESPQEPVVLASTGAAAILVGGRTFHSFFGLGILEGGVAKTVERALKNPLLKKRIRKAETIIIDEISMLTGETLSAAEQIARAAKGNEEPWGNLRVIAVGDFAQLPPVTPNRQTPDWAFLHDVWLKTNFRSVALHQVHRSTSDEWTEVLNLIREGKCTEQVSNMLKRRQKKPAADLEITRLFALRRDAEEYNRQRLEELDGEETEFATDYTGPDSAVEQLRRQSPIPDVLVLKPDALVMIRKNDPEGFYVNGSLGRVKEMNKNFIQVELVEYGMIVEIEPTKFEMLNAEGEIVAQAKNFPLILAWGTTIHKAQGATLDKLQVRLVGLWESGHAYVALSRVRHPDGLFLDSWDQKSIRVDPKVLEFHSSIGEIS